MILRQLPCGRDSPAGSLLPSAGALFSSPYHGFSMTVVDSCALWRWTAGPAAPLTCGLSLRLGVKMVRRGVMGLRRGEAGGSEEDAVSRLWPVPMQLPAQPPHTEGAGRRPSLLLTPLLALVTADSNFANDAVVSSFVARSDERVDFAPVPACVSPHSRRTSGVTHGSAEDSTDGDVDAPLANGCGDGDGNIDSSGPWGGFNLGRVVEASAPASAPPAHSASDTAAKFPFCAISARPERSAVFVHGGSGATCQPWRVEFTDVVSTVVALPQSSSVDGHSTYGNQCSVSMGGHHSGFVVQRSLMENSLGVGGILTSISTASSHFSPPPCETSSTSPSSSSSSANRTSPPRTSVTVHLLTVLPWYVAPLPASPLSPPTASRPAYYAGVSMKLLPASQCPTQPWRALHPSVTTADESVLFGPVEFMEARSPVEHGAPGITLISLFVMDGMVTHIWQPFVSPLLHAEDCPPDAHRGLDVPPAVLLIPLGEEGSSGGGVDDACSASTLAGYCTSPSVMAQLYGTYQPHMDLLAAFPSDDGSHRVRIGNVSFQAVFAPSLLVEPLSPDFSMPFNVMTLVMTVYAFIGGTMLNVLGRKARRRAAEMGVPAAAAVAPPLIA